MSGHQGLVRNHHQPDHWATCTFFMEPRPQLEGSTLV